MNCREVRMNCREVTRFPFKSAELLKDFDVELSECGCIEAAQLIKFCG